MKVPGGPKRRLLIKIVGINVSRMMLDYLYMYIYIYIYILLASVNFFNYFVASFLLCCPCEALEGPISTRVGIILTTTLIQSRHIINNNCFTII